MSINQTTKKWWLSDGPQPTVEECFQKAQAEWEHPKRIKKGQVGGQPYKYADLGQVIDIIETHIHALGCSHSQEIDCIPTAEPGVFLLKCSVEMVGPAGDRKIGTYGMPLAGWKSQKQGPADWDPKVAPTPQETGIGMSYLARYAYLRFYGFSQEDDDAQSISKRSQREGSTPAEQHEVAYPRFVTPSKEIEGVDYAIEVKGAVKAGDLVEITHKNKTGKVKLLQLIHRPHRGVSEWTWERLEK